MRSRLSPICSTIFGSMFTKHQQHKILLFYSHQCNTNNILLTFSIDTQQQHNDMPQNIHIVVKHYIAKNIVNVCPNPLNGQLPLPLESPPILYPPPSQTCAPKNFRWCRWGAEWRVKRVQTWERGPPIGARRNCI